MSTSGIIVSAIGTLIGVLLIIIPLLRRKAAIPAEEVILQKQREHLLVFYEQVLRTIRDLDEDYQTGKVTKETYDVTREEWMQKGTQLLQVMDDMPQIKISEQQPSQNIDKEVEAEIARYLAAKAGHTG